MRVNDYISIFLDYGLQHWHRIPHIILDQNIWMLPNDERKIISTLVCHKINFKFDLVSPPEPSMNGKFAYTVKVLSLIFHLKIP